MARAEVAREGPNAFRNVEPELHDVDPVFTDRASDLFGHLPPLRPIPGGDRHVRTRVPEGDGHAEADAVRASGDEHPGTAVVEGSRHHTGSHVREAADRYMASAPRSSPSAYSAGAGAGTPSSTAASKAAIWPS